MENIWQAINGVMRDTGAVGKNKRNEQQKYQYRGIDDVMGALAPAMQAHGIFVVPEVLEHTREEKDGRNSKLLYSIVKVKYTFYAADGTNIEAVVMGEGMDSGDKATNKAMSAAFKYALLQTFCIPTEELVDSERDSPAVQKQDAQQIPKPRLLSDGELADLTNRLNLAGVNMGALLNMYRVGRVEDLTAEMANDILRKLNNEGNRNTQPNNGGAAESRA